MHGSAGYMQCAFTGEAFRARDPALHAIGSGPIKAPTIHLGSGPKVLFFYIKHEVSRRALQPRQLGQTTALPRQNAHERRSSTVAFRGRQGPRRPPPGGATAQGPWGGCQNGAASCSAALGRREFRGKDPHEQCRLTKSHTLIQCERSTFTPG